MTHAILSDVIASLERLPALARVSVAMPDGQVHDIEAITSAEESSGRYVVLHLRPLLDVPAPVRIRLQSTDVVESAPPPARVWEGTTEDGQPITAWITLGAHQGASEQLQEALRERIQSEARITIPTDPGSRFF